MKKSRKYKFCTAIILLGLWGCASHKTADPEVLNLAVGETQVKVERHLGAATKYHQDEDGLIYATYFIKAGDQTVYKPLIIYAPPIMGLPGNVVPLVLPGKVKTSRKVEIVYDIGLPRKVKHITVSEASPHAE